MRNASYSTVRTFASPPAPGAAASDPLGVRLLAIADMGTNEAAYDGSDNGGHPAGDNLATVRVANALTEVVTQNAPPAGVSRADLLAACGAMHTGVQSVSPWFCGLPSGILHFGDLSYAVGVASEWEEWMQQIEPYASLAALMVQVGNHERNWNRGHGPSARATSADGLFDWGGINSSSSGGECGIPTETRFAMPGWPWGKHVVGVWGSVDRATGQYNDEPWYGFEHGPLFIYQLSSEHDLTPGSRQYAHLDAALSAVNRTRTPWVIVTTHRMMYVSSDDFSLPDGDQPIAAWMRAAIENLLLSHQVDLVLQGHTHNYQRSCRLAHGVCLGASSDQHARAPVYVVMGTAGTGLDANVQYPPPSWIENFNVAEWGYARLWANSTHMSFEFVQIRDNLPIDTVWFLSNRRP